ncbi:type III restriction enzyme, res subunit [bacterium BMS3Abin15]|nr:type III restriction enzyme, res subunit [bacterium BMS3Abin15]
MDKIANSIKNRLSLRPPQAESVNILANLANKLTLQKNTDLKADLELVKSEYPICTDFERSFPSVCFALATGVGKTRLMGAFVAYLYLTKGIKNFFVLAPNLTIYNKLIGDFSIPTHPKYVFQGIGEFVHKQPVIITGDNYNNAKLFASDVHINIFNISKINAETRGGNVPRMKRLSEFLGDSYFNYLANMGDLVMLMDESHHYRATRGMEVINELNPILGLELTATPKVEKSGGTIKFKNVVYEYSLAKAIQDGFVKEPAVATRKNFDPSQHSVDELDRIKLEDGVRIHRDTKVALDIFARDNNILPVKPFVLVVAQNTEHASMLKSMITSSSFFDGYYADKVMEIHSRQSGEEKDENVEQLLSLEDQDNKIEIVIHVNMLKEGWDVTNLYTIIPLRTATSMTLREQTIGRGLRLPYGKRTGDHKVDKLTIVAHDKFQQIIDEANKPDSIIKQENVITIDETETIHDKEVITVTPKIEEAFKNKQDEIEAITNAEEKQKAQNKLDSHKLLVSVLPEVNDKVNNVNELKTEDVKRIVIEKMKQKMESTPQQEMFAAEMIKEAKEVYEEIIDEFTRNIIEIPRITILQSGDVKSGFNEFDLDTKDLNFQPVSEEILRKTLRDQEDSVDVVVGQGRFVVDKLENIIINELISQPEIDYDSQADILFKLAEQAVKKFQLYLDEDKIINVVLYHKREIAEFIFTQMMENFYCETPSFGTPKIYPFDKIREHNYSKYTNDSIHDIRETITPTNTIPSKLFSGFKKACHSLYKFDSKTEKDFAIILEDDKTVLKWIRPAPNQFDIYWNHNSSRYRPDFVVETDEAIYMIETKKEGDIEISEVQEKSQAALEYCQHATEYTAKNSGKPWAYVLIPHNAVQSNMGFQFLVDKFRMK